MQLALHAPDLMKWRSVSLMDNIRELTTDSKSLSYWATEILQSCGMTNNQQHASSFTLITVANSFQKKKKPTKVGWVIYLKQIGVEPINEKILSEKQYYTWSFKEFKPQIEQVRTIYQYVAINKRLLLLKLKEDPKVWTNTTTTLKDPWYILKARPQITTQL